MRQFLIIKCKNKEKNNTQHNSFHTKLMTTSHKAWLQQIHTRESSGEEMEHQKTVTASTSASSLTALHYVNHNKNLRRPQETAVSHVASEASR